MKSFRKANFYEVLEIRPDILSSDIHEAYRRALRLYREESLASYSFFTDDQREEILEKLKEAFSTLNDREHRYRYDMRLVEEGLAGLDELSAESRARLLTREKMDVSQEKEPKPTLVTKDERLQRTSRVFTEILSKDLLRGSDLKRLRLESGISLEDISNETKIRVTLLQAIEEDDHECLPSRMHLRSYLRSYMSCLVADAEGVVRRYLKNID